MKKLIAIAALLFACNAFAAEEVTLNDLQRIIQVSQEIEKTGAELDKSDAKITALEKKGVTSGPEYDAANSEYIQNLNAMVAAMKKMCDCKCPGTQSTPAPAKK